MKKLLLGIAALFTLSACEVPGMIAAHKNDGKMSGMFEITFPAVMLIQIQEHEIEELLTGELIGHASGSAKYNLVGPTFGRCTGGYSKDGTNTLTCENGNSFTQNIGKQKAKMSGVNVLAGVNNGTPFISAFGWGKLATEAAVREAIANYQP
jgi:hypothetical protein